MADHPSRPGDRLTLLAWAQEYMTDPYKQEAEALAEVLEAAEKVADVFRIPSGGVGWIARIQELRAALDRLASLATRDAPLPRSG